MAAAPVCVFNITTASHQFWHPYLASVVFAWGSAILDLFHSKFTLLVPPIFFLYPSRHQVCLRLHPTSRHSTWHSTSSFPPAPLPLMPPQVYSTHVAKHELIIVPIIKIKILFVWALRISDLCLGYLLPWLLHLNRCSWLRPACMCINAFPCMHLHQKYSETCTIDVCCLNLRRKCVDRAGQAEGFVRHVSWIH